MKKTLLVLMMAMAATVGCVDMSSFVPTSNNALVLDAQQVWVSKETKAPVIGTTFPITGTMSISSYSSASSSTFFTDIPFSYNSTDGGWKANSSKYWPQTGTLDFLAYSCTGLTPTSVTWNSTNASAGITSFVTGDNRTAQADLMFGAASGCAYSPSSLPTLNFKHAMSLVTFTGLCPDSAYNGTTGITIESITLATAYYGGTCSVTRSGSTVNSISWSATANSYNGASVPGISSVGLPTTATPVGNGILLPPQSAVNFTINYKVWSGGVATSKSYTYTNSGTWEMAKRHVYAIEITLGNDVVVKAGVEDWADTAKNWFYADGNVVKNVGNEFTLASGQPVFWREGTTGAYQQLTYYSGTYGSSVTYSATNYFVTVTKSGDTYTVSYVSKNRTEYDYQIALSAPHSYIEPTGTMQYTAILQKRQRTWTNGSASGWSSWQNESTISRATWTSNSEYATVNSSGVVTGNNDNGSGTTKNVTISVSWTSYLGGSAQELTASTALSVLGGPIQVRGIYADVYAPGASVSTDIGYVDITFNQDYYAVNYGYSLDLYIEYNTGERIYLDPSDYTFPSNLDVNTEWPSYYYFDPKSQGCKICYYDGSDYTAETGYYIEGNGFGGTFPIGCGQFYNNIGSSVGLWSQSLRIGYLLSFYYVDTIGISGSDWYDCEVTVAARRY